MLLSKQPRSACQMPNLELSGLDMTRPQISREERGSASALVRGDLRLTKVQRKLWFKGELHDLSFAVRADGSTPAEVALKAMLTGTWLADPEAQREGIPSDTQISRRAQLVVGMKYFAKHGVHAPQQCRVNALRDGIWEFKEGEKRVSFFDTPGGGRYVAKHKFKIKENADYPDSFDWEIPAFDRDIRLGHCFGKPFEERTTAEEDIRETLQVREEDLAHDRAN